MDWEYGTHQDILERVLERLRPERSVEHGSGKYSTPLLVKYSGEVVSVERDGTWAAKAEELGATVAPVASLTGVDFAFVDGAPHDRESFAFAAFRAGVPVIIWHDSEPAGMKWYRYDRVSVPEEYKSIRWRHKEGKRKGTTLFWKTDIGYPERWKIENHDVA